MCKFQSFPHPLGAQESTINAPRATEGHLLTVMVYYGEKGQVNGLPTYPRGRVLPAGEAGQAALQTHGLMPSPALPCPEEVGVTEHENYL